MVCTAPGIPWNAARLAPSFALARGLPIYALRDSGAHLGWVYGPVFPLWFFPAGLTDNPTIGLMIATLMNAVALVVPLYLVFRLTLGGRGEKTILMTLLGVVLLLANPITNIAFYIMHVDGLCVAWALMACVALHARVVKEWRPGFPLAAAAVALSVATKQVAVVLLPATMIWLWREGYGRLLLSWIFWLATVCGGLAVLAFIAFGPEQLLFNAWLLFSRMPWKGGWPLLTANLMEIILSAWLWIVAGSAGWLVWWKTLRHVRPTSGALKFARLLGWVALVQAPLGLTASLLVDAALNSIHSPVYLLVGGLVLAGSVLVQWRAGMSAGRKINPLWVTVILLGVGIATDFRLVIERGVVWMPYRGQEELLAIARRAPGKIYLPWNPLITIISERKIYPFDEALHYLWLAKLEPPRAAIRAAVPEGAAILYQEPSQTHFALNYFGQNTREIPIER